MKQAHILLVEDNEGDIFLTKEAFEECKVKTEISVAKNGQEALDFLFKKGKYIDVKKPDLILLDINIPVFNGHEVLYNIKADSNLTAIPVIMLTTSSSQKDREEASKNQCTRYIEKPLDIDEFSNIVLEIEKLLLQIIAI
jgi:CheY-like chemotaxis protein